MIITGDTVERESQQMSRITASETQADVQIEMPTDSLSLLQLDGPYKVGGRVIGRITVCPGFVQRSSCASISRFQNRGHRRVQLR